MALCAAPVPTSDPCACRKMLNVKIIDDEEYEKNKTFTIVLEEPILLEVGQRHGELGAELGALLEAGLEAGQEDTSRNVFFAIYENLTNGGLFEVVIYYSLLHLRLKVFVFVFTLG